MDEFASCGTEVLFINPPKANTPEEALLLQFQGMISEYEHAMIKERSRRGKRFKAKLGGSKQSNSWMRSFAKDKAFILKKTAFTAMFKPE